MLRFYCLIIFNLHLCIRFLIGLRRILKNSDRYSMEYRYKYCQKIIRVINRKGRIKVKVFGLENIPEKDGYIMYSNHQGRYDALGMLTAHPKPFKVVIREDRAQAILEKEFLQVLGAKMLNVNNPRQGIKIFREIEEEVKNGSNYLIYPEGKYCDNRNTLLEFQTGCMHFLFKAKCTILPVTIYDTYKVFGKNSLKKVHCEVHFLKPIEYDEYKDMNKAGVADLIKKRIKEKLNERRIAYGEILMYDFIDEAINN